MSRKPTTGRWGRNVEALAGSLRVAIVDDSEADRWFFGEVVRSRGHGVVACATGEDALASFDKELPDLVLLDLLLPGADGVEVCRRLRSMPRGERPFVLVVTASEDPEALKAVLAAGADDFVRKPVDPELLAIRLAIAERRIEAQDVLRQAEDTLESKTRELETLFANVREAFFSVDVTETRLIQISPAARSLFGHEPEALQDDDALWKSFLLPSEGDEDPWARLRGASTGEPIVAEYAITAANGTERWIRLSVQVRPDRDRGGLRADGVAADITDEYLARQQLAERNRELAALYGLSELTLSATSLEATYTAILDLVSDVMRWPIAGIEHLDEAKGQMVLTAVRGVSLRTDEDVEVPIRKSLSARAVKSGEPVVELDGRAVRAHAQAAALPKELKAFAAFPLTVGGEAFGALFLANTEAVTVDDRFRRLGVNLATTVATQVERLEAEEALRASDSRHRALAGQLRQANQELESFAYSVSHDLRAPLRTMQGFAHSLLQQYGSTLPEEASDYAKRIIASGRQSEELIGDLLAYSRVSFESLDVKPVELKAVVDAAREQVSADLDESKARLDVEKRLPTALGSHTILVQVVANLLSNAVKFVPPGRTPEVKIHAEAGDHTVRLWVEDNGIGVPAGQEERIFRVFERLAEGGDHPGTGIGLAIVRRGVQRLGGTCGVERLDGGGSAFWIELKNERRAKRRRGGRRG